MIEFISAGVRMAPVGLLGLQTAIILVLGEATDANSSRSGAQFRLLHQVKAFDDHSQAPGQTPDLPIIRQLNDDFIARFQDTVNRNEIRLAAAIGDFDIVRVRARVQSRNGLAQLFGAVALIIGRAGCPAAGRENRDPKSTRAWTSGGRRSPKG